MLVGVSFRLFSVMWLTIDVSAGGVAYTEIICLKTYAATT